MCITRSICRYKSRKKIPVLTFPNAQCRHLQLSNSLEYYLSTIQLQYDPKHHFNLNKYSLTIKKQLPTDSPFRAIWKLQCPHQWPRMANYIWPTEQIVLHQMRPVSRNSTKWCDRYSRMYFHRYRWAVRLHKPTAFRVVYASVRDGGIWR